MSCVLSDSSVVFLFFQRTERAVEEDPVTIGLERSFHKATLWPEPQTHETQQSFKPRPVNTRCLVSQNSTLPCHAGASKVPRAPNFPCTGWNKLSGREKSTLSSVCCDS